jgi:hypothetical protein
MGLGVNEVVGNQMMMMVVMMDMKIVQDEKAREEETRTPEWVRNPAIKVVVIPGRGIVSDNRWTFSIVVLVNYRRRNVFTARRWWTFCVLLGSRHNS